MAKAADLSAASELCPERRKVITEGGAQLLGRERHARACALNTALTSLVQRNKGPSAPCVEALEEHVLLRVGHEVVGRLLARDLDERLQSMPSSCRHASCRCCTRGSAVVLLRKKRDKTPADGRAILRTVKK